MPLAQEQIEVLRTKIDALYRREFPRAVPSTQAKADDVLADQVQAYHRVLARWIIAHADEFTLANLLQDTPCNKEDWPMPTGADNPSQHDRDAGWTRGANQPPPSWEPVLVSNGQTSTIAVWSGARWYTDRSREMPGYTGPVFPWWQPLPPVPTKD